MESNKLPVGEELRLFLYKTFILLGLIIACYIIYSLSGFLILFFSAIFLSVLLSPLLNWFNKKGVRDGVGIFFIYIALLVFFILLLLAVLPIFVKQADVFMSYIQSIVQKSEESLFLSRDSFGNSYIGDFFTNNPYGIQVVSIVKENISAIGKTLTSSIWTIANSGAQMLAGVAGFFMNLFMVMLLNLFIILDRKRIRETFYLLVPNHISSYLQKKEGLVMGTLQEWLRSQFILSITIFIFTYIGLWILEIFGVSVEEKAVLAVIAGATELIPYIGPFLGFIPAFIIGTSLWLHAIGMLTVMYLIIQQAENNILVPYLMSKNLNLSPLIILVCAIVGGMLFGILGIILAVPLVAIWQIFISDWIANKKRV